MEKVSLIISFLSLLISFLTLYAQRKRLLVTWIPNLYILDPKSDILVDGYPYPVASNVAFYGNVDIVNPSKSDISFFDLRAFNPKTNTNHYLLTKRSIFPTLKDSPILLAPFPEDQYFVTIPERKFGMLRAGSYTSLDLVVYANPNIPLGTEIMISFKVSDTSLLHRSFYSNTNRIIFKEYHFTYSIKGYEDILSKKIKINRNEK